MEHLDRIDETAAKIGAVNTVTRMGDELVGSNTDYHGALRALEREIEPKGRRAVVLGAGGAARAVVYALVCAGADVTVLNRTESKARDLVRALSAGAAGALSDLVDLPHDILVNTTSVGLRSDISPVQANHLREGSVVMDAVYDPVRTRLLTDAVSRGARPVGGKWMLVHQAAEQVRLWTDRDAPLSVMEEAFDAAGSRDGALS